MYEKQLFGRKVLYFQYAPPITKLDDVSDDGRPNPPFRNAPPHQRSVYFYWWAFLRENPDYINCCDQDGAGPMAELYRDFGDVRSDDFMGWWRRGGRLLFCEPIDERIEVYLSPPQEHDNESRVLLSLPMTGDVERTFAELRQLLKPIFQSARRSERPISRARYPVRSKAVVTSLHQHLTVYQLKRTNPQATNYEIAQMAGIAGVDPAGGDSYDQRNSASVIISRYISQTKALLDNVGLGRFPDFTKPPK